MKILLDLATQLRGGSALPDISLAAIGAGDGAWDAWSERVRARGAIVIAEEREPSKQPVQQVAL